MNLLLCGNDKLLHGGEETLTQPKLFYLLQHHSLNSWWTLDFFYHFMVSTHPLTTSDHSVYHMHPLRHLNPSNFSHRPNEGKCYPPFFIYTISEMPVIGLFRCDWQLRDGYPLPFRGHRRLFALLLNMLCLIILSTIQVTLNRLQLPKRQDNRMSNSKNILTNRLLRIQQLLCVNVTE